ncbi:MAG: nucleotide exchange factor GrpE [Pirellulales bacterium]
MADDEPRGDGPANDDLDLFSNAAPGQDTAGDEANDIDLLRTELEDAKDRILRAQADLENYRKRSRRELDDERRYANLPLLRDLLPVLDNVGRAIEAAEKTPDPAALLQGFKMVAQQLERVLGQHHCTRFGTIGEPFDPHHHEALMQRPTDEHPANTVVEVFQSGFQLHDRVVRPAQVIVSAPKAVEP